MLGPVVNAHTRGEPIGPVGGCELVWGQNLKNLRRLLPVSIKALISSHNFIVCIDLFGFDDAYGNIHLFVFYSVQYLNESTFAPATFLVIGTTYTVV